VRLFGLMVPRARLLVWHTVLALCLVLPAIETPRRAVHVVPASNEAVSVATLPVYEPVAPRFSWERALIVVLAGGTALRLLWLGLGMWRLRRYRLSARPFDRVPAGVERLQWRLGVFPELLQSREISGPVTFGFRRPVVLFPARFTKLETDLQTAVACHELLHVRRRDWLWTVIEECVRAVFWFHPAIWWLLGEIQLTREQTVDREVVRLTEARGEYVDALLAVAGARPQLDLAPAPLFLRKRHLKQRVISIFNEVSMSKRRIATTLAASAASLAFSFWLAVAAFPFQGAAQVLSDGEGVSVETGARILHRLPVEYPAAARTAGVQGNVVAELVLDKEGNVADARVLSGPEELRRAVLTSVLGWHYSGDVARPGRVQATVAFRLSAAAAPEAQPAKAASQKPATARSVPVVQRQISGPVQRIDIVGLAAASREELANLLPVHEGDNLTNEVLKRTIAAVKAFDAHLLVQSFGNEEGQTLRIVMPGAQVEGRIGIADSVPNKSMKLVKMARPAYPAEAKQKGVQGEVKLRTTIGTDGKVLRVEVLAGDPMLVQAAVDAVQQWEYLPAMVDGKPAEVKADVTVNFALAHKPA
jgi:TonB family protein